MIKKGMFVVCGLFLYMSANAQNAYDAERVLSSELNGTARYVGMGGAMSALGGDISVIGTNPAGIGIYRSNDLSMSFGLNNTGTKSNFNGVSLSEDRTRASLDQLGFVYSHKIGNTTSLRFVNFGFNYHKSKNFNRLFSMGGNLKGLSQTWQMADELSYAGIGSEGAFNEILNAENPYKMAFDSHYPILSVLGIQTGLVDWVPQDGMVLGWDGDNNNFYSQEKGGVSQYDFNVAFNIEDRVYLGATLGIYDVAYSRYSSYTENLLNGGAENGGYTLRNYYDLDGSGFDLKLGVIVRPFEDSPFRVGLAVHTPTWYELTERTNAAIDSDIYYFDSPYNQNLSDYLGPDYLIYDYNMVTPWKFNVSAGTTLSGVLALGAEYEFQDYSSTKLEDIEGYELGGQYTVDTFLKGVHTLRAGMEARVSSDFSVRIGYNFTSGAFKDNAYAAQGYYDPTGKYGEVNEYYRTQTDYNNTKSKNTFTFGAGYRGGSFYADFAYKYDLYKSDFYAFDIEDIQMPVTKVDNSRHQLLLTLGARF